MSIPNGKTGATAGSALATCSTGPESGWFTPPRRISPLYEIVERLCQAQGYAQDIMYPAGVNGPKIGGDACAMPIPDRFADQAALTCSLEHFEGDSDIRLFRELARVLRPGGRVVVIPLYLFPHLAIQTDPLFGPSVAVPFDVGATVYCAEGFQNRHARFYSPEALRDRLLALAEFRFTVYRLIGAETMDGIYARFALVAERRV